MRHNQETFLCFDHFLGKGAHTRKREVLAVEEGGAKVSFFTIGQDFRPLLVRMQDCEKYSRVLRATACHGIKVPFSSKRKH